MQAPSPGTTAPEVSRTLHAFARATRARQLYATNNQAYLRMRADLLQSFDAVLQRVSVLTLRIRPDRILFEDETILEESDPNDSIPFALYRDGLRRMDFSRGVSDSELEAFLHATAAGFAFSGLGDDIVSHLWQHDLEHIRYLVVDTSIVEAAESPESEPPGKSFYDDVEAQIDGLLQAIYGSSTDDVGPRAVHLDAADLGAKRIAAALDDVHEMAPGFHPPRRLPQAPAYGPALLSEVRLEAGDRIAARAANAALRALQTLRSPDRDTAAEGLLRMFDAAVMANDLPLAARLVAGVRAAPDADGRVTTWLNEAVSEARIRQAASPAKESTASKETFVRLFQFLKACGAQAVPLILPMLGQFADPVRRRALTDLVADLGGVELARIRSMLDESSIAVVQEALHLLQRSDHPDAAQAWSTVEQHPNPFARLALLDAICSHHHVSSLNSAARLLNDPEGRVRVAAVECLTTLRHPEAAAVIAVAVEGPSFEQAEVELKRALLRAYAVTNGPRALHILSRIIKRGEGRLVRRESEELAIHAVLATAAVKDRRSADLLKRTANSKNRRIREAAQQALRRYEATG